MEIAHIANDEFGIPQTLLGRLAACIPNRLRRQIHPRKLAVRVLFGQPIDDTATPATDIQHANPFVELGSQFRHERQDMRFER